MSKAVQYLARISQIRRCAITTTLLSALVLVSAVVVAQSSPTRDFKLIHGFNLKNGADGEGGLITDKAGNLYGTTVVGGDPSCNNGCGLVFKIDSSGKETVLHKFTGETDGANPQTGMVMDPAGNLYGGAFNGGSDGEGVIFKVAPSGTFTVLYAFTGGTDGGQPYKGQLVLDKAGNIYGTTYGGGDSGYGVVFKVDPSGKESVLHSFTDTDGSVPEGLVRDAAGNLYGITGYGGDLSCGVGYAGCGTAFKLDQEDQLTVLHTFVGGENDGAIPYTGATLDKQGNLYGTTVYGGYVSACGYGCGVVWKIDSSGKETILHDFYPSGGDGFLPEGRVALDSSGNLYGTTLEGGNYEKYPCAGLGCGVVFKIDRNGKETILHAFTGGDDGAVPLAGVLLDGDKNIYGITAAGGNSLTECPAGKIIKDGGCGVVFKITQ
jgi:uncharacterized repeat protein (TIGR03803 family)